MFGYKRDLATRVELDGSVTDLMARDFQFSTLASTLKATTTGDVDLSSFCTPSDQKNLSSCVGNATADAVEVLNAIAGYKSVPLSRLYVYSMARIKDGDTALKNDAGTYIRSAFSVLTKFGVCDEYLWPYDTSAVSVQPSLKAHRQAAGHRIEAYYRINSLGQARIDDVITALRANHPVVFGTTVTKSFLGVRSRTPLHAPSTNTDPAIGGHALFVCGYINGNFLIKNSWGTGWGDHGFCMMAPDYLSWGATDDLWVPTLGSAF